MKSLSTHINYIPVSAHILAVATATKQAVFQISSFKVRALAGPIDSRYFNNLCTLHGVNYFFLVILKEKDL